MAYDKIIISGVSGFIGQCIAQDSIAHKYQVHGLSRRGLTSFTDPNYVDHKVDLSSSVTVDGLDGTGVLVHLAATVPNKPNTNVSSQTVTIAQNVAQLAVDKNVPIVVLVSSVAARIAEQTPESARAYGFEKRQSERVFQDTLLPHQKLLILRPPAIYGPKMNNSLALLAKVVRRGLPLPLGSAHAERCWLSLGNLSDLVQKILTAQPEILATQAPIIWEPADPSPIATAHLCSMIAQEVGVKSRSFPFPIQLLQLVGKFTGKRDMIESLTGELLLAGNEDITDLTGWTPKDGMPRTLKFLRDEMKSR